MPSVLSISFNSLQHQLLCFINCYDACFNYKVDLPGVTCDSLAELKIAPADSDAIRGN